MRGPIASNGWPCELCHELHIRAKIELTQVGLFYCVGFDVVA